jgi:uncharacterized membrane protein YgcG
VVAIQVAAGLPAIGKQMKRIISILLSLAVILITCNALSYIPPKPDGHVTDMANKLTSAQKAQLHSKLDSINQATGNEIAALIIPSMDGESIEDVAQDTFRAWGLGKKNLDNGVLVVVAISERKSRIQTGKGVEGDLPDLKCNDILRQQLNPSLKRGDFYGGLNATFNAISSALESRKQSATVPVPPAFNHSTSVPADNSPVVSPATKSSSTGFILFSLFGLATIVIGLPIYIYYSNESERKEKERLEELEQEYQRIQLQHKKEAEARLKKIQEDAERTRQELERVRKENLRAAEERASAWKNEISTSIQIPKPITPKPIKPHSEIKQSTYSTINPINVPRPPRPPSRPSNVTHQTVVVPSKNREAEEESMRRYREAQRKREEETKLQREKEEREASARRKRDEEERRRRDEEDDRRRRQEDDDRRSSYSSYSSSSSSSSYDSGGSSWGGFGGGDSGGGGSSSDW